MPKHEYLSINDVVKMTGIKRTTIISRLKKENNSFPEPDVEIAFPHHTVKGWLPSTITNFNNLNTKEI
nr:MAG TPA: excisionase [Caudoviricetes sp.]